jgi:hypothetical protein
MFIHLNQRTTKTSSFRFIVDLFSCFCEEIGKLENMSVQNDIKICWSIFSTFLLQKIQTINSENRLTFAIISKQHLKVWKTSGKKPSPIHNQKR